MIRAGVILGKRYEVQERIGTGGMAEVYRGKDQKLNRFVAIKVLKKEYREDDGFIEKFMSEAQAAAGLMHPNIVNVYDVGEDRGLYYMVMELVEGITLKDYIEKKGNLSARETISIAIQVCTGIQVAHNNHIIHRDIKPQNIIISKEGKVKVTDFGIAKAVSSHTTTSNAMGSVHYTSPEQARGGFSDEKSDVYSTGITIYEMVTGRLPFDGETTVTIAVKHLQEEITPPSAYVPDIPHSLEQIILKCTQKNSDYRYPNMEFLIADLKRSLVDPEGDFVTIVPFAVGTETVMISPEELSRIQQGTNRGRTHYSEYDEDEYEDEYDDGYDDEYDEYEDDRYGDRYSDDDEYGEDEYETYDDYRERGGKSEDVNPRMAKVMKILTIVVTVIIAFILLFVIGKATGILKFNPITANESATTSKVKVPSLVGKTEAEAEELCKAKGLKLKIAAKKSSDKYEEGYIMEQKTAADKKVAKGAEIQVVVSSGLVGKEIVVPDTANQPEDQAMQTLKNAGIEGKKIKVEYKNDDNVASGNAIGTTPAAGAKVTTKTDVVLMISKGVAKVKVPKMVNKSRADAEAALSAAGLSANVMEDYSDSYAEGTVMSQGIEAGKEVDKGTVIDITVSLGKKPEEKVTIPWGLIGSYSDAASNIVAGAGLQPSVVYKDSDQDYGIVIEVKPGEGVSVSPNSVVTIVASNASKKPQAPTPPAGEGEGGETTDPEEGTQE